MSKPVTLTKSEKFMSEHEPFEGNSLRGVKITNPTDISLGMLPRDYQDAIVGAVYVVYSYATPIGWVMENDEVIIPPVKYSVTTSKHQNRVRSSLKQN